MRISIYYSKEGDVLKIGDIVRKKQPDVYRELMKIANNKGKNTEAYVDYKK